jgi:hypothetical protein
MSLDGAITNLASWAGNTMMPTMAGLAVPFLILFKYGRPRGYLTDLVRSFFAPRAWCALERDSELIQPYVVDEEE